jgi:hypothetical protein
MVGSENGEVETAGKVTETDKWCHQVGHRVVRAANCDVIWEIGTRGGDLRNGDTDCEEEEGEQFL